MRNWERCAQSPRDEGIAQLFERLMDTARAALREEAEENKEDGVLGVEGGSSQHKMQDGSSMSGSVNEDEVFDHSNHRTAEGNSASNKSTQASRPRESTGTPLQQKRLKTNYMLFEHNNTMGTPQGKYNASKGGTQLGGNEREALVSMIQMAGATSTTEAGEIQKKN